jgi:ArsR family transcriptional regulator
MEFDKRTPGCDAPHEDKEHEEIVRAFLPDQRTAENAAAVFTQLSDATRVRLLCMLADSELCVCEMSDLLGMSQPAVSHHLRGLREVGAIRFRRVGQRTIYSLNENEAGDTIRRLLKVAGCGKVY